MKGASLLMNIDQTWYTKPEHIRERMAAGGIIIRKDNEKYLIALMYDKKFPFNYELPKGGVEKGEEIERAARREIQEEIGFTELELLCYLGQQERLSYSKRSWAVIHYYLFKTRQKEGIPTDVSKEFIIEWLPLDSLPEMLWPEQKRLIEQSREKIRELI